jgi:hypothetical protein
MPDLRAAAESGPEGTPAFGPAGAGTGVDVLAELERVRANLVALAERFEDLRTKYNAHTHNGGVAAPPAAEQSAVPFTLS